MTFFALEVDPMVFAAAVGVILAAFGGMAVQIISAYFAGKERVTAKAERALILDRTKEAETKARDAATATAEVIKQTEAAHVKLDSIKSTAEKAEENVNGNLSEVRKELARSMDLNQTLLNTIQSLMETVKTQRAQSRSTDRQPEPVKVDVVNVSPEIVNEAKKEK